MKRYLVPKVTRFGIVEEITGKERRRVFIYRRYLDILGSGTEPLER
jgi:hypothetical protein